MDPEANKEGGTEQASSPSPLAGTGTEQASSGTATPSPAPSPDERKTESELAEARRQAAAERRKAADAERKLAEIERAQLSEQERVKADLAAAQATVAELQGHARAARLENVLLRNAGKLNILPTALTAALKLLDTSLLEWDEATNTPHEASVDRALKALIKDHPFLVAAPDARQPAPAPAGFAPQGQAVNGAADEQGRKNQARISGAW